MFKKLIMVLLAVLLLFPAAGETATSPESSKVTWLLMQSRMSHEPEPVIRQAVQILDQQLDEDARNMTAWRQLAQSLSIGLVQSRHAKSANDAWRQAYELDKSDCHTGALATPFEEGGEIEKEKWIQKLGEDHPHCAEALFLRALIAGEGSTEKTAFLKDSLALKPSSDALVLLAQELNMAGNWQEAEARYTAALLAAPLFPEDWRPDGRVAVHAHLGLAWSYFSRGKIKLARREYKAFLGWFEEPGPWHDLSEAEELWRGKLDASFTGTTRR